MAIEATNYDGTKDYSVAEIKDVYYPNLLINGDFKINQRGQSSYNYNTNGKYGLDCWMHRQAAYYQSLIVEQLPAGGVKLTLGTGAGGGIRQYVKSKKAKVGEKYTTAVKFDGTVYTGTVTLKKQSNSDYVAAIQNSTFTLDVYYDESNDCIGWSLWITNGNASHEIKYADLFEGEIVYPHVEEDYTVALDRCKAVVKKVNVFASGYSASGTTIRCFYNFDINMISNPTITVQNVGQQTNIYTISEDATTEYFNSNVFATNIGNVNLFNRVVILSCEILP